MSSFIDSIIILQYSELADTILVTLTDCFKRNSIQFPNESNVIYNDFGDEEKEPDYLTLEDEAMKKILSWPSLGGVEYNFSGYTLSVFIFGTENYHVDALTISMLSKGYFNNEYTQKKFNELIIQIHHLFQAKRSIIDYELLSPNSFWAEELMRVRNNIYLGKYLLDLRQEQHIKNDESEVID